MTSFPILMEPVLSSDLSIDKNAYKKDCPGSCLRGCTSQALSLGQSFYMVLVLIDGQFFKAFGNRIRFD